MELLPDDEMSMLGNEKCEHEHLSLNGVSTDIITFGPNLFELSKLEQPPETIIFVIPGNPGIIKYYEEFMRYLFNSLDRSYPVWGISHAGTSDESESKVKYGPTSRSPRISGNVNMYNLEGQIKHKKFFINDFIPDRVRLVLIGHSIGAYIVLELLERLPTEQVAKAILLFPTIERISISPNGKWATPVLNYLIFLPTFLALIFSLLLSREFKLKLIRWYFKEVDIPECVYEATLQLMDPGVLRNFLMLAKDEMEKVVDVNSEIIQANKDKLILYYGGSDNWCPVSYYQDMVNEFPGIDARLCIKGMDHAFVLKSSLEMAREVSEWLKY